ncbi:MAG TPA: sulfurtransferase TusA family protein, partial [Geobacteraceae bacterium]|nr:sulfurtransferase TusA family protein [Geobacteraceae bacterium]
MKTIDLRGVSCPTNFVKAKLALEMVDAGEVVEFLLDDGEPVKNVP